MSIVKIHLYRSQTQKQQKYLLTFLPEIHSTIAHFLEFAIKALQIQNCTEEQLLVENDGYILPHCLDGTVIKQMQLLTIKVKTHKKILPTFWTAQKIDQPQENTENLFTHNILSQIDQEHLDQSQSTPKFSQDGLNKQILPTKKSKQSKHQKTTQPKPSKTESKKKKKVVEEVESSQSSEEEVKKPKTLPKLKNKNHNISFAKSQSSEESQEVEQSSSEQSSEEESSEQELPRVSKSKKVQLHEKVQQKKVNHKKEQKTIKKTKSDSSKSNESSPKQKQELKKPKSSPTVKDVVQKQSQKVQNKKDNVQKGVTQKPVQSKVTYQQRKKIIEADDIESSDSSSEEQVPVKKVITEQKSPKTVQNAQPTQNAQPRMLPPALRNKPQQNKSPTSQQSPSLLGSFKKQQQQKWIPITKQIIETYKKTHQPNSTAQTPFSQPNNLIRFKEIELDEERFVPKTSQWIDATVDKVQVDGRLRLSKVTQMGREYRDRYEIYEHNMVEFQVNRDLLTKEQRQVVMEGHEHQKVPLVITQNSQNNNNLTSKQTPQVSRQQNDRNSIQKFICGQVNYYFSDKNYQFDLFMQMHANKHPQKYIPVRFLLNFPKIKKILKDQHKLFQYLLEDQRKSDRNYEIDEDRRLVRRKVASVQGQNKPQAQRVSEQKLPQQQQESI